MSSFKFQTKNVIKIKCEYREYEIFSFTSVGKSVKRPYKRQYIFLRNPGAFFYIKMATVKEQITGFYFYTAKFLN
jgi:hypothetical protein